MRRSRRTRHCRVPFERRDLRPNDILMEVLYTGICHTDLHKANQQFTWKTTDGSSRWPGHESPRTTKLYDRTKDEVTLREVEGIRL